MTTSKSTQQTNHTHDQGVSYEEIIDILNRRHNYDRIGDNDIM